MVQMFTPLSHVSSRRELIERFDELLIELAARAYEDSEELPTTSIEDLLD